MILYSIIPAEVVFENRESKGNTGLLEVEYLNEKVVVSPLENNQFIIDRIISTSPKAYLNKKLQPGTVIHGVNIKSL